MSYDKPAEAETDTLSMPAPGHLRQPDKTQAFHALSVSETARLFDTNAARGLEIAEAENRLLQHGENRIDSSDMEIWPEILVRQFTSGLVLILVAAAVLSLAVGH